MHLAASGDLDVEGKGLPIDHRAARDDHAPCKRGRLSYINRRSAEPHSSCILGVKDTPAGALTCEVDAVAAVGRRVGPHEREAAFERVRVVRFAVGVAQAAAPQNKKTRDPLLE